MQHSNKGCAPWIPARYVLAVLGFTGITLQYVMKVNLSVAIVAMVRTNLENGTKTFEDSCSPDDSDDVSNTDEDGEFDWDISKQGLLLSSYYYGYVTTQLLGGYLSQKYGGRLIFGPGVAITGVLTLLTVFVARKSFVGLLILRAVEGIASGVVIPSMQAMFSRWYPPQERQRMAGFIFSSINFGSLTGLLLSGLLAGWGGWTLIFYVTGSMGIVWFVLWILLAYDSPQIHPRISDREKNYIVNGLGQESLTKHKTPKSVPWLRILLCPPVWAGILFHTGNAWILYTLLNELPTYLKNVLHFNVQNSGVISSLPHLFAWISANFTGVLSQWLRDRGYLGHLAAYRLFNGINCFGVVGCFLAIIFVGCDAPTIVVMFMLSMFFDGFLYGGSYLNHVDLAPNHAGAISGLWHTVLNTPGFVTPIVTSAFLDGQHTRDRWQKVFYLAIGIMCGVYLFYLIFGSVTHRTWNTSGMEDEDNSTKRKEDSTEIITISTMLKNDLIVPNYGNEKNY